MLDIANYTALMSNTELPPPIKMAEVNLKQNKILLFVSLQKYDKQGQQQQEEIISHKTCPADASSHKFLVSHHSGKDWELRQH